MVHPRREGTDWLMKTLTRFRRRRLKKDIDNIYYLSENMLGRTFCPLGDAAAMPTCVLKNSGVNLRITWKDDPAPSKKRQRAWSSCTFSRTDEFRGKRAS
jgi:hypothetical protein